jgi:acetyl-CoA synthetase (ADP-forming)
MTTRTQGIVRAARERGETALSEHDSKRVLAAYGVPTSREVLVKTRAEARAAAKKLGWPVVLKACSAKEAHKTEKGLIAVGLAGDRELREAFATLQKRAGTDYDGAWLVQEMVRGSREVMIGMVRDPQFGPSVCFGLGGIFTEILQDVAFRVAPLRKRDALEMMRAIRAHRILGAVRGMKAVDADALSHSLMAVGQIALDHPEIAAIDVNPLIVRDTRPVAVDALIVLDDGVPS